jgi:hypothetical protein
MELETGESPSRRNRLKEAFTTLARRDYAQLCEEERKPMVTDALAKDENTVTQFGENQLAPYIEDVAAMMVDEDLPYDELRQVLDNRLHDDSSFVSVPFDFLAPDVVSEAFNEQEPSVAFDQQVPVIISKPFIEQVSESVAELKPPALESFADSLLDETYSGAEY